MINICIAVQCRVKGTCERRVLEFLTVVILFYAVVILFEMIRFNLKINFKICRDAKNVIKINSWKNIGEENIKGHFCLKL